MVFKFGKIGRWRDKMVVRGFMKFRRYLLLTTIFLVAYFSWRNSQFSKLERSLGTNLDSIAETKNEHYVKGELYSYQSIIFGYYKVVDFDKFANQLSVEIDSEITIPSTRYEWASWWHTSLPKYGYVSYSNRHITNRKFNLILLEKNNYIWLYKGPFSSHVIYRSNE
jgi:hypothetical protein